MQSWLPRDCWPSVQQYGSHFPEVTRTTNTIRELAMTRLCFLPQHAHLPGQLTNLLRVAVEGTLDVSVRQVAAITLKNLVKTRWESGSTRPRVYVSHMYAFKLTITSARGSRSLSTDSAQFAAQKHRRGFCAVISLPQVAHVNLQVTRTVNTCSV